MSYTTWITRKHTPEFLRLNHASDDQRVTDKDSAIRLYKSSPESATLQIRSYTGLTSNKTLKQGKVGHYLATVSYLSLDDLRRLRDGINTTITEIENG